MILRNPIDAEVASQLDDVIARLELAPDQQLLNATQSDSQRRRRGFDLERQGATPRLSLVYDENEILRWVYQPAVRGPATRRARRAAWRAADNRTVYEKDISETPPNQILQKIAGLDDILTPCRGLRRIVDGQIDAKPTPGPIEDPGGPILLLVHGTFSSSDMYVRELSAIQGREAGTPLIDAHKKYKAILAFDHATLSVSPWINALDLEQALVKVTSEIDVVCHSRGGLVVAWWLRLARRNVRNVVFVGAPLHGTSLASPANLRAFLDYCAGIGTLGGAVLGAVPLLTAAHGLSVIVSGLLHAAASTPLADAAVVIVPGLASQSRVGNNVELDRLRRNQWPTQASCHAVMSNFEPRENEPFWKVWKFFHRPKEKLANWAAEALFDEPNDLVVNTQSMNRLYRIPGEDGDKRKDLLIKSVQDFGTSNDVHHTNYFRQPATVRFIRDKLKF